MCLHSQNYVGALGDQRWKKRLMVDPKAGEKLAFICMFTQA